MMRTIGKNCCAVMFVIMLVFTIATPNAQASDHYIWSNREYRFWIDDATIVTNSSGTLATFNLVCENLLNGTSTRGSAGRIIFHADRGKWLCTIGEITKPVEYYDGWWQPFGLHWLQENGYLLAGNAEITDD